MKIPTNIACVGALAAFLSGCTVWIPVQITDASRPVTDLGAIELIGEASGESCSSFFLGIPVSAEEPMKNAYARAKEGADGLVNVTVDSESTTLFFLYQTACVTVRGDKIRYAN